MTLETDRLILHPLTHNQLLKYVRNDNSLEKELKLKPGKNIISDELEQAIRETILPNVIDSNKNYLYNTLWSIISKADEQLIGDLCFVGEPDANGEIEIGYSTYPEFRNKGFMTEAIGRLVKWAATQPEVKMITASTEVDNIASYSILEKNNFEKITEGEGMFTWKLSLK